MIVEKYYFDTDMETRLLANDNTVTRVQLYKKISTLSWEETFQRFHISIANNTVMDRLYIDVRKIVQVSPGNGTELLLKTVEESNCIKTVVIENGFRLNGESRTFGSALVSAISRNRNLTSCRFYQVRLHFQDLITLIQDSNLTELIFNKSKVDFNSRGRTNAPDFNENVREVGDAFEQNKTINILTFRWHPTLSLSNLTILEAARRSQSIRGLNIIFHRMSDEQYDTRVLADVAVYLSESKVNSVILREMNWDNGTFGAFTSNIVRNSRITSLKFIDCNFDRDASIMLKNFLTGNQHINALLVGGYKIGFRNFHNDINVLGDVIGKEKGPKVLRLEPNYDFSSPTNGLDSICTGLASKTSKLRTLILPCLSPTQLEYFLDKVSTFKNVRILKFALDAESEYLKGKLFSAIRRNRCLYDFKIEAPWMTGRDSNFFASIGNRNRKLTDLVKHISNGRTLPLFAFPLFFYSSAIATMGTGPKDIVAMLTMLDDKICNPDTNICLSVKERRVGFNEVSI